MDDLLSSLKCCLGIDGCSCASCSRRWNGLSAFDCEKLLYSDFETFFSEVL